MHVINKEFIPSTKKNHVLFTDTLGIATGYFPDTKVKIFVLKKKSKLDLFTQLQIQYLSQFVQQEKEQASYKQTLKKALLIGSYKKKYGELIRYY